MQRIRQPVNDQEYDLLKDLPKGVAWVSRYDQISKALPRAHSFDWFSAFKSDDDLFGKMYGSMLGLDAPRSHTWGPRGLPGEREALDKIRQWQGEDHTLIPFKEAFVNLTHGMSIRSVASKTGLDKNLVYRLMRGNVGPDIYSMEQISKAFGKQPGYFLEYRLLTIFNAMMWRMTEYAPESSVILYRKLLGFKR